MTILKESMAVSRLSPRNLNVTSSTLCKFIPCLLWIILHFAGILQVVAEDPLDILMRSYLSARESHTRSGRGNFDNHRHVRDCQPIRYGNTTYETHSTKSSSETRNEFKSFSKKVNTKRGYNVVSGHIATISNPFDSLSVLEPHQPGGCGGNTRATVAMTSKQMNCHLAVNAGFFNTHTGSCLGNVVSNGKLVRDAQGIRNANFGIWRNGSLVVGYLSEQDVTSDNTTEFHQLVTGVVWILRNGQLYVNESIEAECQDTEETGTIKEFAKVLSARTAVGHDKKGRVVIVQIDGKTNQYGLSLYGFGKLLQSFGLVNAINLDGGGSSTFVENGSVVNYPSDQCHGFNCARKVSTILCVHDKLCNPPDCNGNGQCGRDGMCNCKYPWSGPGCLQENVEKSQSFKKQVIFCNNSTAGNCTTYGNVTTKEIIKRFLIKNYAWMDALLVISVLLNFILLFVTFCGRSSNRILTLPRGKANSTREDQVNLLDDDDEI